VKIAFVSVSRGGTPWADEAVCGYRRRIARWLPTEEIRLRPAVHGRDLDLARREEAGRLLAEVRPGDRVVALDERGRALDTPAFRDLVARAAVDGCRCLRFLLGGAHGLDERVRLEADLVVSLSPLVLNHEVARVVLVEQVYRALSLEHGEPYSH
jgi:23S rRNA (pseudouridine1915-N3)-methyltransferase